MDYTVEFIRDGRHMNVDGLDRAGAYALAEYLLRTFRIMATVTLSR